MVERQSKEIRTIVASTSSGEQISFPLAIIRGENRGPVVGIIAGLHGGEYCSIDAALRMYSLFNPPELNGEVRIVPVANVPGFMSRTMFVVPQDKKNLAHHFPGRPDGSYSEQLARLIHQEVIDSCDCVIELRGGELVEMMAPYASVQRTEDEKYNTRAKEMAESCGIENVILREIRPPKESEAAYAAAAFSGKLSILIEAGGQGLRSEEDVTLVTSAILNISGHLGMIDHKAPASAVKHTYMDSFIDVVSPAEGMFYCEVEINEEVRKGSVVGIIRNYGDELVSQVHAPEDGIVLGIVTSFGVRQGTTVMGLGRKI